MKLEEITIDSEFLDWFKVIVNKSKVLTFQNNQKKTYHLEMIQKRFEKGLSTGKMTSEDIQLYRSFAEFYHEEKSESSPRRY